MSPKITSVAVEATEFMDMSRRYQVTGVPKMVMNDEWAFMGALPEPDFVESVLAGLSEE